MLKQLGAYLTKKAEEKEAKKQEQTEFRKALSVLRKATAESVTSGASKTGNIVAKILDVSPMDIFRGTKNAVVTTYTVAKEAKHIIDLAKTLDQVAKESDAEIINAIENYESGKTTSGAL